MEDKHYLFLHGDSMDIDNKSPKRLKCSSPLTSPDSQSDMPVSFFVVCDGHGGSQVADYVNKNLYPNISSQPTFITNPEDAITNGFLRTETELATMAKNGVIDGGIGTTVAVALIVGSELYVANIGDTEAVIFSGAEWKLLTEPHTLNNLDERKRVEAAGGKIIGKDSVFRLGHPLWNPKLVNLGITRAIGDFYFKDKEWIGETNSGLIAVPNVVRWTLTTDDEFLLIASDGFWDVVTKDEAMQFVKKMISFDSNSICSCLINLGKMRNSKDNLTVVLVKFVVPSPTLHCSVSTFTRTNHDKESPRTRQGDTMN